MNHGDREIRERGLGIQRLERRIVPLRDLAHEYLGEGGAIDGQLARLYATEIDHRDDAPHHHRPLLEAGFFQVLGLERRVGGAEGNGLGLDLLDAGARADRLIVQAVARRTLIRVRPFGVDRKGECRARAGNVAGPGTTDTRRDQSRAQEGSKEHACLSEVSLSRPALGARRPERRIYRPGRHRSYEGFMTVG
jgi:hypothetical protein